MAKTADDYIKEIQKSMVEQSLQSVKDYTFIQPQPFEVAWKQFMGQTQHLSTQMPGWTGWNMITSSYPVDTVTIQAYCPHGHPLSNTIAGHVFQYCGDGISLANENFKQLQTVCDQSHANIPPAGSFIYSYTQSEPIAYAPKYGAPIAITEFQQKYNAYTLEHMKQLEYQLMYEYSWQKEYTPWNNPDPITQSSGSGILGTLMKLCPGIQTVARPCPDCAAGVMLLAQLIPHINDNHQWSREKIASWLDIISEDPDVDLTIKPLKEGGNSAKSSIGSNPKEVAAIGSGDVGDSDYPF